MDNAGSPPPIPPYPPYGYAPQPPPPPAYGYGPGYGARGPVPGPAGPVIQVKTRGSGFLFAVGLVGGLFLFGVVFVVGLFLGVAGGLAAGSMDSYIIEQNYRTASGRSSGTIAVIPVVGVIDEYQVDFVRSAVKHVQAMSNVKAVILRVDSPGGGVTESDQIWYEIEKLKGGTKNQPKLPVIASYGGVAASGGYYVSCGADHIMAETTTITGSIGVIAQILTLQGLMDKVGVEPVTLVATGSPEKNVANDMFRKWDERDRAKIKIVLDSAYKTFNERVRQGRQAAINAEEVDALANGSIYTAQQALDGGLIDSIGYLDDAIATAESMAGLATGSARVTITREPPSLFGRSPVLGITGPARSETNVLDAQRLRSFVNELSSVRLMYLMQ